MTKAGLKKNRMIVDVCMTVLLLFLMAYQVTGEEAHEWIGISMTALTVIHQILNRRWYGTLFKGKYIAYRIFSVCVNILLLLCFALTAFCGMTMSNYAVPFLYGMAKLSFVRRTHLAMSHWAFILMGMHIGLHVPAMIASMRIPEKAKTVLRYVCLFAASLGLYFFLKNNMPDYLLFRVHFAFLDYDKAAVLVLLENILMLSFWIFIGFHCASLCMGKKNTKDQKKKMLRHYADLICCLIIAALLCMVFPFETEAAGSEDWMSMEPETEEPVKENAGTAEISDGFVKIEGGSFMMGSPEEENWRSDDEVLHEVTVSSFYIDPYEALQKDYEALMGNNPSQFENEALPVETVSWLDAVKYANAKSEAAGLLPAYTIENDRVIWVRSSDGYRLPTEAEWEYACRADTSSPFSTERSPDASMANFYGHYPYEIEENYFDNSVLDAKPGIYRETTIEPGSFEANPWGLYDVHGNVNEWCWDIYGAYETENQNDPSGASEGTRHVYRGGGWNDFAKNMRSAYRAAGQEDLKSYSIGIRLVRSEKDTLNGTVSAEITEQQTERSEKVLIAYFSWSGNTRGIAEEIQKQTGADLFEITPEEPYSSDYNTVLMEAQHDQHIQARPELANHVEDMDQYDTVILGYPNWWASIPMPVASFLEEYDFSSKTIYPFCSHGGGRFGQSLTAIAKLAPDADLKEGLSIHYSGGSTMKDDVSEWLETNGLR